jgi:hypothetical protein
MQCEKSEITNQPGSITHKKIASINSWKKTIGRFVTYSNWVRKLLRVLTCIVRHTSNRQIAFNYRTSRLSGHHVCFVQMFWVLFSARWLDILTGILSWSSSIHSDKCWDNTIKSNEPFPSASFRIHCSRCFSNSTQYCSDVVDGLTNR